MYRVTNGSYILEERREVEGAVDQLAVRAALLDAPALKTVESANRLAGISTAEYMTKEHSTISFEPAA